MSVQLRAASAAVCTVLLLVLLQPSEAHAQNCKKTVDVRPVGFFGLTPMGTITLKGAGKLDALGPDLALVEVGGDPKRRYPLEIVPSPKEYDTGKVVRLRPKAPLPVGKKLKFTMKAGRIIGGYTVPSWTIKPAPKRKKGFKPAKLVAKQVKATDGPYVWHYRYSRQFKLGPNYPKDAAMARVSEVTAKGRRPMLRWIPIFKNGVLTLERDLCTGTWPARGPSKNTLKVELLDAAGVVVGTTSLVLELPAVKK